MSRLPAVCPHRPPCPGCPRYGDERLDAAALATLTAFCERAQLSPPAVELGSAGGYRHRVRLAVRGRVGSPKVGIFAQGTHDLVDLPSCPLHHPLINRVVETLKVSMSRTRTPTYSESAQAGLVRYLQVVVERASQRAQVTIVVNALTAEPIGFLLEVLQDALGSDLHSLYVNGNTAPGNAILGPSWHHVTGPECVEERIGGARVFYPPGAFGQSHLSLADRAVSAIHALAARPRRLVELYAGVGSIGLGLVDRCDEVVFNEMGAGSLRGLELGVAALGTEISKRVGVHGGPAGAAAGTVRAGDTVIVDPPRKGLDRELCVRLAEVRARRVLYLSCHLPSLMRDAEVLLAAGYRLTACRAYGFLPFTTHIETLACFE